MIFADMKNSQPHKSFYWEVVFLSWGGIILRKVESIMMLLLSESLASLSPYSSVRLTGLL